MSRYLDPKADVPEIAEAIQLVEESAYTPGELDIYQSYWDSVSREKTLMLESHAVGEAKGRAEQKIEIAKTMIAQGCDPDFIKKITGLSESEY